MSLETAVPPGTFSLHDLDDAAWAAYADHAHANGNDRDIGNVIDFPGEWSLRNDPSAQPQESEAKPLPIFVASELAGKPIPPRLWHVDGIIPAHEITLFYGDGGTGKSLLILQLMVSTALRLKWLGMDVAGGSVIYLSAEDGRDEIHRRLNDILAQEDQALEDLTDLHIIPLAGEDDTLLAGPGKQSGTLQKSSLFAQIEKAIKDIKPALVVLDTLSDVFGGEENHRPHVRQFVRFLRRLAITHETTIVVLAHPSLEGMRSGRGSSGSTTWNGSVRSRLYLDRVLDADGKEIDPDIRVLRTMKLNYGPRGGEIKVRWYRGAFIPEIAIGSSATYSRQEAENHADAVFLKLVEAYWNEGRNVSTSTGPNYAPAIFFKDQRAQGVGKKGLEAAMNRLFEAKRIESIKKGPPSRERTTIVVAEQAK